MDPVRQIRLLVPPFFFFLALISGILLSSGSWQTLVVSVSSPNKPLDGATAVLAIVGTIGVTALPVGFLISTLTMFFLRGAFTPFKAAYHTNLSDEEMQRVLKMFESDATQEGLQEHFRTNGALLRRLPPTVGNRITRKRLMFHVAVAFDHGVLYSGSKGLHEWLMRTYSAYMTSANSAVALLFAFAIVLTIVGYFSMSCPAPLWWCSMLVVGTILTIGAWRARRDTLQAVEFFLHSEQFSKEPT